MLRSDAQAPSSKIDNLLDNIGSITVETVAQIEKELVPYDLVSLVFLLYDVPDTALQRLIIYQRVSKDIGEKNMNLLYDWAQYAQSRTTWKYEFLEALAVCQLYGVIRKLGFNVQTVQKHYLPNNIHANLYINPMKKALYKLCENMTSENLEKIQNTLKTYDIDTTEYKACEIILVDLMCKKFIKMKDSNGEKSNSKYQIDKLVKIIQNFSGLQQFGGELMEIQRRINNEQEPLQTFMDKTPSLKQNTNEHLECKEFVEGATPKDFSEIFELLSQMSLEEPTISNLKSDTKVVHDAYPIINPKRVGVCYIINQEDFHPSKESIESSSQSEPLKKRLGSNRDRKVLETTMSALNFEVISHQNIGHKKMLEYIKDIVQYRVQPDHSMFMLCILSHGVRDHVYAADSVKVKIDKIRNLLDEGLLQRKLEIPKILVLQACRVNNDDETQMKLVADNPSKYLMKKSDFLICWATAPELEAYRDENMGSIFIQILCYLIKKHVKKEHLYDIFTKVTNGVAELCKKLKRDQIPSLESTLRKKLYLQIPE